jgi:hypothetical protein
MIRTETINGIEYQIGKLGAFEQLHVGRKLAPLLAHAIPALMQIGPDAAEKPGVDELIFSAAAIPMADVLARMSKEDVDYVLHECLAVCQRRQAKGWARVFVNGVLMFQDIEADTLFQLTKAVVEVSLGRFFPTSQSESAPTAE